MGRQPKEVGWHSPAQQQDHGVEIGAIAKIIPPLTPPVVSAAARQHERRGAQGPSECVPTGTHERGERQATLALSFTCVQL